MYFIIFVLAKYCIKLNFMPFACLFCGIFISKCQIPCYMQCLAFLFNNQCVLLQRTLILWEWCFFESNIFLFHSQPRIFTCIMHFVGVQIKCLHINKLTNVNFTRHYANLLQCVK